MERVRTRRVREATATSGRHNAPLRVSEVTKLWGTEGKGAAHTREEEAATTTGEGAISGPTRHTVASRRAEHGPPRGEAWYVLVEIGPEGWTPTQQSLSTFPSFGYYYEATSTTRARKGKRGNA
jgi:hypothetical protein